MECVIELVVLGPGEHLPQVACPGLQLIRNPEMDTECLAQLLSGACPPFQQAKADLTAGSLTARPAGSPGWSPESRL